MESVSSTPTSVSSSAAENGYYCEIDAEECKALQVIKLYLLSIDCLCSLFTLTVAVVFRKFEHFSQRIFLQILVIHIMQLITALSHDGRIPGFSCMIQGFFINFSAYLLLSTMTSLIVYLYLIIVKKKEPFKVESYEWFFSLSCWSLSLGMACLPLITRDYGPASSPYCWIKDSEAGQVWRYLFWLPMTCTTIGTLFAYIYIYMKTKGRVKKYGQETQSQSLVKLKESVKPLTYYSAAFVLFTVLQFTDRIQNTINDIPLFPLMILHIVNLFSHGIVICCLFFVLNGPKEFTNLKLDGALSKYRKHKLFKAGNTVIPFSVDYGLPTVSARGIFRGANKPVVSISYIGKEETTFNTAELPIVDIRTYDATRLNDSFIVPVECKDDASENEDISDVI